MAIVAHIDTEGMLLDLVKKLVVELRRTEIGKRIGQMLIFLLEAGFEPDQAKWFLTLPSSATISMSRLNEQHKSSLAFCADMFHGRLNASYSWGSQGLPPRGAM